MAPQGNSNQDDQVRDALHRAYGDEKIPFRAQTKLEETYARLGSIPQVRITAVNPDSHGSAPREGGKKASRRALGKVPIVAAALVAALMLCGFTAYAASRLLEVGPNEASYFEGDSLPVYDTLQAGTASLSADVGESQSIGAATVTFDTVSTDRNIVNLFFTIEQEGGFDLGSLSLYEGSNESEWARLQRLIPSFGYSIASDGEKLDEGSVRRLDAYLEDGKVRCMMRIVPHVTLPDHVDLSLNNGFLSYASADQSQTFGFSVGLDLSAVAHPQELGSQDLIFQTQEGEKKLSIERFTVSDFGTVFVAKNYSEYSEDGMTYGIPDNAINPSLLKITDAQGNVLSAVDAGDGMGFGLGDSFVIELSGLQSTEGGVTFTPMLVSEWAYSESLDENFRETDATQIGTKLPMSEYGGYELIDRSIEGNTISIALHPYGWLMSGMHFELIPLDEATILWEDYTDPETGEAFQSGHSGIRYTKYDYKTGDLIQMDSYYAASEEELQDIRRYTYRAAFGAYTEDADAALAVSFRGN